MTAVPVIAPYSEPVTVCAAVFSVGARPPFTSIPSSRLSHFDAVFPPAWSNDSYQTGFGLSVFSSLTKPRSGAHDTTQPGPPQSGFTGGWTQDFSIDSSPRPDVALNRWLTRTCRSPVTSVSVPVTCPR